MSRRRWAQPTAAVVCTGVLGVASQLLLVVAVSVSLVAHARIPRIVGVKRAKAAVSGARAAVKRLLVGARCRPVVAVLELARQVVEPADDAAASRSRWSVGRV